MNDEDYNKVAPFLTLYSNPVDRVNINTAPEAVLRAVRPTNSTLSISDMLSRRKDKKYTDQDLTTDLSGIFTFTSAVYKIYSYAAAGGYTKQIETIVNVENTSNPPSYWRTL
jgi:type II secretory pathway component PulK